MILMKKVKSKSKKGKNKSKSVDERINDWYLETYGEPWTQEVANEVIREEQEKKRKQREQGKNLENYKDYNYQEDLNE